MSISVNATARVSPASAETQAPANGTGAASARSTGTVPAVEIDRTTQQPVPPRFPWLSRLASQLEPVAKQKPAFPSAPQLGDNLDQAA